MKDKIINYARKYHTARVYQIIITIMLTSLAIAILFINTFYVWRYGEVGSYGWLMNDAIVHATNGSIDYYLPYYLTIFSTVAGVLFIWLNRPQLTLISLSGDFSVFLIALLIEREFLDNYGDLCGLEPSELFYVLLASFLVLVVFVIFAIKSTQKGSRPPRPLKTVRVNVVENTASSEADEIRKLKALLDDGIITEEEFNQKKKKILGL